MGRSLWEAANAAQRAYVLHDGSLACIQHRRKAALRFMGQSSADLGRDFRRTPAAPAGPFELDLERCTERGRGPPGVRCERRNQDLEHLVGIQSRGRELGAVTV